MGKLHQSCLASLVFPHFNQFALLSLEVSLACDIFLFSGLAVVIITVLVLHHTLRNQRVFLNLPFLDDKGKCSSELSRKRDEITYFSPEDMITNWSRF